MRGRGQNFCRSTRRCRRSPRSCRVCRTRSRRQARFQTRFQTLSEKSGICRKEADILEEEIQTFQAGEQRRGSCASRSNGCCFNTAVVEQFLAMGAVQAMQLLAFIQEEICRVYGGQYQPRTANQWILLWILFGVKLQTVEALEEEILAH